jgi:hypothetical protein
VTLLTTTRPTDAPAADIDALFKEAKRRRRRRWLVGLLIVVVLVAAAITVRASSFASPRSRSASPSGDKARPALSSGTPREIVGWTSSHKVVVVSTATGRVVRTLASDVAIFAPGLPNVSVAPGGTVYFESAEPTTSNQAVDTGDQIFGVPITGGTARVIAAGSDPQVSPNGRFLAFISPVPGGPAGEAPYLVPPVGIDIATLSSDGAITQLRTLSPGPAQLNQGASDLSWSSNSEYVSFDLLNPSTNVTTSWTTVVAGTDSGNDSLAAARQIHLRDAGLTWNGYWGGAQRGAARGLGVLTSASGHQEIVTVNPSTGRVVDRLFAVPADVCTATFPSEAGGCNSDFSNQVIGDNTGSSVLVSGAIPFVDGTPTTSGKALLYRWSVGAPAPVRLTPQVLVATWGPPPASR